jgi:chromosome segregation ATPase
MVVAFETEGGRFARKYKAGEEGTVTQEVSLNGKKLTQKQVERTLIDLGNPRIFDLQSFNKLSEDKQIEFLLALSPPSGDLKKINLALYDAEEKEKRLRADIRGKRMVIEQLSGERSSLKLPAGTLAEIQAEIKSKTADLEKAQEELKVCELEEQKRKDEIAAKERERVAKEKAEAKAKKDKEALEAKALKDKQEAEAKAKREADASKAREAEAKQREAEAKRKAADALKTAEGAQEDLKNLQAEMGQREKKFDATIKELVAKGPRATCADSLRKVRQMLLDSGCEVCSALIILNLELQNYEEEGDGTNTKLDNGTENLPV